MKGNQDIGFTVRLGHRFHLTLGAHGKAIMAFMDEQERENFGPKEALFLPGPFSNE